MFGQGLRQTYWRAAVVPHQPARAAITNSKVKATGSGSATSATSESAGRVRTRVSANEGADVAKAASEHIPGFSSFKDWCAPYPGTNGDYSLPILLRGLQRAYMLPLVM